MSTFQEITARNWNECRLFDVLLELTHRCNYDCFFCYNDRVVRNLPLTSEEYSDVMEQLADMAVMNLTLTGGEPLVHPDFFAIGNRARELGFVIRVKSNGHLLRGDMARRLRDEVAPYQVDLSVHGATAATHDRQTRHPGSFDRLLKNIEEMSRLEMRMRLNCTVTAWNEGEIEEMYELADRLGLLISVNATVTPKDDGDTSPMSVAPTTEGISRLSRVLRKRREKAIAEAPPTDATEKAPKVIRHCGAGASSLTIDQWGDVMPCVQWRRVVGNVREQPIAEIWSTSSGLEEVRALTVEAKKVAPQFDGPSDVTVFCPGVADLMMGNALALYPGLPSIKGASSSDDADR
ncbi:radical SAM/SPASM domain-containing protein [Acidobacteriota bacterium]